jgi:hypothetical protein
MVFKILTGIKAAYICCMYRIMEEEKNILLYMEGRERRRKCCETKREKPSTTLLDSQLALREKTNTVTRL